MQRSRFFWVRSWDRCWLERFFNMLLGGGISGQCAGVPAGIVLAALFLPDDSGERRTRTLDGVGFPLLSPGLVLFLYGSDHLQETTGRVGRTTPSGD
jgi:hypothetical protein